MLVWNALIKLFKIQYDPIAAIFFRASEDAG